MVRGEKEKSQDLLFQKTGFPFLFQNLIYPIKTKKALSWPR